MELREVAELNRLMHEAEQSMVPADLKAKGWVYKDLPGRLTHDAWDLFIDLMGDGEYQVVIMSSGTDRHGTPYKRGQFFISPEGIRNLADKDRLAALRAAR